MTSCGQENRTGAARAFSLLEVVLALAILAGALAALGEVMRLGDQNAAAAGDETQAELLAESVMAEILVGARPLTNVSGAALAVELEPQWVLSIALTQTEVKELLAVRVSVAQDLAPELQPARCDLVRWVPNPDYLPAVAQQSATTATESSTGGDESTSGGQQ
jgi:prepilin-type N-terminal cleavage/methylation domain-containing protein